MSQNQVRYAAGEHDFRPWGEWLVVDTGPGFVVKRIRVAPGGKLSLQRHRHRMERWVVVAGVAHATLDGDVLEILPGGALHIPQGAIHRVENRGETDLVFVEVQTGAILDEADIERLEDDYGR